MFTSETIIYRTPSISYNNIKENAVIKRKKIIFKQEAVFLFLKKGIYCKARETFFLLINTKKISINYCLYFSFVFYITHRFVPP